VSGQLHAPAALLRGKEPPVPICWAPQPVWTTWRRENFWPLPGLELRPLGLPARSQSLYRLRYRIVPIRIVGTTKSYNSITRVEHKGEMSGRRSLHYFTIFVRTFSFLFGRLSRQDEDMRFIIRVLMFVWSVKSGLSVHTYIYTHIQLSSYLIKHHTMQ
jgi:hypothetical protein